MATKAPQQLLEKVDGNRGEAFTLDELRVLLSDSIRDLREDKANAANVNAISNATGKFLSTVKTQMEYYRLIGRTPSIPDLLSPGDRKS